MWREILIKSVFAFRSGYNEKQEENGNVCYKYDMAYLFGCCKYFAIY